MENNRLDSYDALKNFIEKEVMRQIFIVLSVMILSLFCSTINAEDPTCVYRPNNVCPYCSPTDQNDVYAFPYDDEIEFEDDYDCVEDLKSDNRESSITK